VEFVQEFLQGEEAVLSDAFTLDVQVEPVFTLGILRELDVYQLGVALADRLEDDPGGENVSLAPLLLLRIEVLQSIDPLVEHLQPARVVNVVPIFLLVRKEDLEWFFEMH